MGDNVSEASSNWARDEFEFVDEVHLGKQPSSKESLDSQNHEEPVSAAVSIVVSSARHGVVALCASVAHILREKKKLQERVADLEKRLVALENSSSGTVSVSGSCSVHCQATNLHGLQESPVTQRCGSAPASFIASGLKFLRTEYQNNVTSAQDNGSKHVDGNGDCHRARESGTGECRTSSISMPETHSDLVPKIVHSCERKSTGSFVRGPSQASTRSLNLSRNLPVSSFVRRKYSTISLRRVRRSAPYRQKASSICSTNSINSCTSFTNSDEQRRSSNNSSSIITVAEIHTPPDQQESAENTEGEAVKLLARTLTSVLQGDTSDQEQPCSGSCRVDEEVNISQASKSCNPQEFGLPHPLAGCECVLCTRLAADPGCQLYALTTEGGSLLPPGSRVLVEGERVGTVVYLGHEKYPSKSPSGVYQGQVESAATQEGYVRPVGITVKLWAPDQGEIFVPLSAVICQLDDNLDLQRKESWSSFEYEYLEEDSDEEHIPTSSSGSLDHHIPQADVSISENLSSEISIETNNHSEVTAESQKPPVEDWKPNPDSYFIRSPSVSSCSSVISHSLGDLSVYGLECEDDVEFSKEVSFRDNSHEAHSYETSIVHSPDSEYGTTEFDEALEDNCSSDIINTTFISKSVDEDRLPRSEIHEDYGGSLYDTCDSAISLSFTKRLQYSEDNSEPSSLTDTWDSGCSVGRTRCRSDSSGHFSDMELENTRLGSTFTKSLGDALNYVLEKHNMKRNWPLEKLTIENEKNIGGDVTPVNSEIFKRYRRRKEPIHEYQCQLKEKARLSTKSEVKGNTHGHSEV